jgi:hypothetical protein
MAEPICDFHTRSFISNPIGSIVQATIVGLVLMSLGISLNAPIYVSMALLFSGILLVYANSIGSVHYQLFHEGIGQTYTSWAASKFGRKSKSRFFKWNDIRSYKNDREMRRNTQEYEYLKLYLNKNPGQLWITDQVNSEGFRLFKEQFLMLMNEKTSVSESMQTSEVSLPARQKSFYESLTARIITLFFLFLCGGLIYWAAAYGMRETNWIRLAGILVPGTAYLVYRVFFRVNRKD